MTDWIFGEGPIVVPLPKRDFPSDEAMLMQVGVGLVLLAVGLCVVYTASAIAKHWGQR